MGIALVNLLKTKIQNALVKILENRKQKANVIVDDMLK